MKVIVGDKVYGSEDAGIGVILHPADKLHILKMDVDDSLYGHHAENMPVNEARAWMRAAREKAAMALGRAAAGKVAPDAIIDGPELTHEQAKAIFEALKPLIQAQFEDGRLTGT